MVATSSSILALVSSEAAAFSSDEALRFEIISNDLLTSDSFDQLVCYVEFAKELRESIVEIFNLPEHKLLWRYYHEQSKTSNDN